LADRGGSSPVVEASPIVPDAGRGIRRIRVPQKLRNLELFLLIIACGINAFAVVLVQLGAIGTIDSTVVTLGASLSVLVLAMHVALRYVAPNADPFILPVAAILNGTGIAVIYHIDLINGDTGWDSTAIRQVVWSAIALLCAIAVVVVIRNHRVLQRYTYVFMFAAFVLLLLPMLPGVGQEIFGARVWIQDRSRSSRVRSRRSCSRSSSPASSSSAATPCRSWAARSSACGSRGPETSGPSS
jgi:hypothetical protein